MKEGNGKLLLHFTKKNPHSQDNILPNDHPLSSDGIQHPTEEELRIFWHMSCIYDVIKLKFLGGLVVNAATWENKIQSCQEGIFGKNMELKKHEHGETRHSEIYESTAR